MKWWGRLLCWSHFILFLRGRVSMRKIIGMCVIAFMIPGLSEPAFGIPLFTQSSIKNASCSFQCSTEQWFTADNFNLAQASTVESINFFGVRSAERGGTPNLDFTTTIDWRIYAFDSSWDNTVGAQNPSLGALLYSGVGVPAIQGTPTFPDILEQARIEFTVNIPDFPLDAGQYWLALHADISGWDASGNAGHSNSTTLDWAYGDGDGDGIWAYNRFGGNLNTWTNPNPNILNGGVAFSIHGSVAPIPEPTTLLYSAQG